MNPWKDSRPPFANYDLVVYFGCGLFALPLIFHYITEPTGMRFPRFQFQIGIPFADTAISTLSLLFAVYLLGHMIAYAGSAFVEKTVDLVFGKVSSSVLISNLTVSGSFNETVQGWIARRLRASLRPGQRLTTALRFGFYVPVLPGLAIMFGLRWFDYFKTRVPPRIFSQIRVECERRGFGPVSLRTQWYKAVEHDVTNNRPFATARMYNYLVIGGLFRSLTFLFVMCAWGELYYLTHLAMDGHYLATPVMSEVPGLGMSLATIAIFNLVAVFSLSAYVKFARRYVEEALFAFVLARSGHTEVGVGAY